MREVPGSQVVWSDVPIKSIVVKLQKNKYIESQL